MSMHIDATLRTVESTDYDGLTRFFDENNRSEITVHFHPFPLTSQSAYEIACTDHLDRYYVVVLNSEIIGLCMLRGWDEGFAVPSFGVVTDHRYYGLGLGRRMTEFALNEARRLNCPGLRLSVYQSNIHALHLYGSLGFGEISRESVVLHAKPDIKIVMLKDLQ